MDENKRENHFWKGALCGALAMFLVGAAVLAGAYVGGINIFQTLKSHSESAVTDTETEGKLEKLKRLIDSKYLYSEDVSEEDLEEGLYTGYVNALGDPYSVYYDEEETKVLNETTSGEYSGIGVVMTQLLETNEIIVSQVYDDSPAQEAGLKDGDLLYKVNGKEIGEQELSIVVKEIRGEEGTTVDLTVLRGDSQEEVEMTIERRVIQAQTVSYEMLENQVGYIDIMEFDTVTYDQFVQAFDDLNAQGMEGLIVDLRSNPGGNLITVTEILDLLLPEGTIVYTEDKNGEKQTLTSDEEHQFTKPMAVLVNEYSASASEIFAGAIQDYDLGPIVGTTTYGKGVVQQIVDLGDGTCVKLTISEYYTPNGRSINKKGVEPDVEVAFEADEEDEYADNQLDKALEEVKKKI